MKRRNLVIIAFVFLSASACSTIDEKTPVIEGSKRESISVRVEAKRDAFEACFLESFDRLSDEKKAAFKNGTIRMSWIITQKGKVVEDPKVVSDLSQLPGVGACLAHVLKGIQFEPIVDGGMLEVTYPFRFSFSK